MMYDNILHMARSSKKVTNERKERMIERIQEFKVDKQTDVMDIIKECNPDMTFKPSGGWVFIRFDDLTDETHTKLAAYIEANSKKEHAKKVIEETEEDDDLVESLAKPRSDSDRQMYPKKLRQTNHDTQVINRVKFEQELRKNAGEDVTYLNPDTFHKRAAGNSKNSKN